MKKSKEKIKVIGQTFYLINNVGKLSTTERQKKKKSTHLAYTQLWIGKWKTLNKAVCQEEKKRKSQL